jgi:hypothetical protein
MGKNTEKDGKQLTEGIRNEVGMRAFITTQNGRAFMSVFTIHWL